MNKLESPKKIPHPHTLVLALLPQVNLSFLLLDHAIILRQDDARRRLLVRAGQQAALVPIVTRGADAFAEGRNEKEILILGWGRCDLRLDDVGRA